MLKYKVEILKHIFEKLGQKMYLQLKIVSQSSLNFSPASEVSREVANLNERKNPHTHVNGVKEFVCLSVHYKL